MTEMKDCEKDDYIADVKHIAGSWEQVLDSFDYLPRKQSLKLLMHLLFAYARGQGKEIENRKGLERHTETVGHFLSHVVATLGIQDTKTAPGFFKVFPEGISDLEAVNIWESHVMEGPEAIGLDDDDDQEEVA